MILFLNYHKNLKLDFFFKLLINLVIHILKYVDLIF